MCDACVDSACFERAIFTSQRSAIVWVLNPPLVSSAADLANVLQNDKSITIVNFVINNYEMKKAQNYVDWRHRDGLCRDKTECNLAK